MTAIETTRVWKRFGTLKVLQGLNLQVNVGEVYGLLGPNGAGKSTLIHLLLGFLRPDKGELSVLGGKSDAVRERLGWLPERVRYHTHQTAREYLTTLGQLSDLRGNALKDRCRSMLELVGLGSAADRRVSTFSKGMLQRLGIAQALLHDPDLLLIDEPTSGLDPAGQREMIELISELRHRGHTILMCSHHLNEVEELCDRVGILNEGRLAAQARMSDLSTVRGVTISSASSVLPEAASFGLRALGPSIELTGREIRVVGDELLQRKVLRLLLDAEVNIAELKPLTGGLGELYLNVTRGDGPPPEFAPPVVEPELLDELLEGQHDVLSSEALPRDEEVWRNKDAPHSDDVPRSDDVPGHKDVPRDDDAPPAPGFFR